MAEEKDLKVETPTEETPNNEVEELKKQLAEAQEQLTSRNNDYTKLKASFDKTASEVSKYKKDLQAKLTEEELAKIQREEADQKNAQELNELKGQLANIKAMKRYTAYGLDEKSCNECAEAEKTNDFDKILSIIKAHHEADIKKRQAEWLNGRPEPQAGGGNIKTDNDPFLNGFGM